MTGRTTRRGEAVTSTTSAERLESVKGSHIRNKERDAASKKEWAARNKDKLAAASARYRAKNKAKIAEADRRYRQANAEACREQRRRWKAANPDKVAQSRREWRKRYLRRNFAPSSRSGGEAALVHIRTLVRGNDLYAAIWSALSGVGHDHREDIASEAFLLMTENPQMRVAEAIPLARRMHLRATRDWGVISLDAPMINSGNMHEILISSDMEHF